MKTYRLTAAGRRMTLTLMAGAVLLWVFAFWMLQPALGIRYLDLPATLSDAIRSGLGAGKLIPAAILLLMLVAAPLLLWSLCEEWATSYTVGDDGLTYSTVRGITVHYPWNAIRALRPGETEDTITRLIVQPDAQSQIRSRLLRWLHRQAFGAHCVPIYADVQDRDELVAEIIRRSGLETRAATQQVRGETPGQAQPAD